MDFFSILRLVCHHLISLIGYSKRHYEYTQYLLPVNQSNLGYIFYAQWLISTNYNSIVVFSKIVKCFWRNFRKCFFNIYAEVSTFDNLF